MKILFISNLYPTNVSHNRLNTPFALHYFTKEWIKNHDVQVIVPTVLLNNVFKYIPITNKQDKYIKKEKFVLDEVPIYRIGIKKYPKYKYSSKSIEIGSNNIINYLETIGFKPDIIVTHMLEPSIYLGIKLKKYYSKKLVICFHNYDYLYSLKKNFILKDFIKYKNDIDIYAYRSKALYDNMVKSFPILNEDNPIIVPSGVEQKLIISPKDKLTRKYMSDNLKIITVSRLVQGKNIDTIIQTVDMLIKDGYKIELTIVGDGEERVELEKTVKKLMADKYIKFTGALRREDVFKELSKNDVFVLVSSPETFGLVYLEAMAQGCIVIGSKGEGISDVIRDEENGYLVTPRDKIELYEKLKKISKLSNIDKEILIKNTLNTVNNYTDEFVANNYISCIEKRMK